MKRVRLKKLKEKGFYFEGKDYRTTKCKNRIDVAIHGVSLVERDSKIKDITKKKLKKKAPKKGEKPERFVHECSAIGREKRKGKSMPLVEVRFH
jgi:hypothetical protein